MRKWFLYSVLAVVGISAAQAEMKMESTMPMASTSTAAGMMSHTAVTPAAIKWGPAPNSFPAGAMFTVLYGDPGKTGPFAIRMQMPAGYKIPAHTHPTDENVTVISGVFSLGMGKKLSTTAGTPYPSGSYISLPANMAHFAWTQGGAIVQVEAMGPFSITYIDPKDDPRNMKQ